MRKCGTPGCGSEYEPDGYDELICPNCEDAIDKFYEVRWTQGDRKRFIIFSARTPLAARKYVEDTFGFDLKNVLVLHAK